ncbi:hypothetical protein P7C70_g9210, partial [Phenoliferia sp. Uapishka_3]
MATRFYCLHDLVNGAGKYYSVHPYKARFALLHKGAPFQTINIEYPDLSGWVKEATGVERPKAPFIKLRDDSFLFDSFAIAEHLETAYPDKSSIFLPEMTSYDPESPDYVAAKAAALKAGGDRGWFPLFALGLESLTNTFDEGPHKEFWKSDEFLGAKNAWQSQVNADRPANIKKAKRYLSTFSKTLSSQDFLSSRDAPGFLDYALMGKFAHGKIGGDKDVKVLWEENKEVDAWSKRMEEAFGGHAKELLN